MWISQCFGIEDISRVDCFDSELVKRVLQRRLKGHFIFGRFFILTLQTWIKNSLKVEIVTQGMKNSTLPVFLDSNKVPGCSLVNN